MQWSLDIYVQWFQSAPLTDVRGDAFSATRARPAPVFQSAPLTDVRGDLLFLIAFGNALQFQSAPLTDVRGDIRRRVSWRVWLFVSIRSPH